MSEAASGFQYSEARFAQHVGISRDDTKFLREQHLVEGEHWKKNGGHDIVLTLPAVKRLWRGLRNPPSTLDLSAFVYVPPAKKGAPDALLALPDKVSESNPVCLTVTIVYPNPRVLRAKNEIGDSFEVYVGNNANFYVGMEGLLCVPFEGRPNLWRLVGGVHHYTGKETRVRGLPPRKGRWY